MSNNLKSSFRDPSGHLFKYENKLLRSVSSSYSENYDILMTSGLYEKLVQKGFLIPHKEIEIALKDNNNLHKVLEPEFISYISYPYEWSFSQLKDAALLTLKIQKLALKYGLSLKDASAYNVQFHNGKPVFIDTLSFEKLEKNHAWIAYKQFCQHFLAPLALMAYTDIRLNNLAKNYIDGIPLDLASKLLPFSSKLNVSLLMHIHMHAKSQKEYESKEVDIENDVKVTEFQLLSIIDSLESAVKSLKFPGSKTEWGEYYTFTNYEAAAFENKKVIIEKFLDVLNPSSLWDLGANNGHFSKLASDRGIRTCSLDIDPVAVEKNYLRVKQNNEKNILPLLIDLTNPSPAIGWANAERDSISNRGQIDVVMALALIHHIAISNNVPLEQIAEYFKSLSKNLIIEFVPKSDSQVKKLLATRKDIFPEYTQEGFEKAFQKYYKIRECVKITDSERFLYLMESID